MDKVKIEELKQALIEERNEILEDLNTSSENISNLDLFNKSGDLVDQAYNYYEKELLIGLSAGDKETLKKINDALKKIENDTYGVCEDCNELIEEKRLEAIPYAQRCIECKKKFMQKSKVRR